MVGIIFRDWEEETNRQKDGLLPMNLFNKLLRATRVEYLDVYVDDKGHIRVYDLEEEEEMSYKDAMSLVGELVGFWNKEDWDNPPRGVPFTSQEKEKIFKEIEIRG